LEEIDKDSKTKLRFTQDIYFFPLEYICLSKEELGNTRSIWKVKY